MFDESDVEQIKVEVAARKLQKLNPDVQIEALPLFFNDYNAIEVVDGCDVVIGLPNPPTTQQKFLQHLLALFLVQKT